MLISHDKIGRKNVIKLQCDYCMNFFLAKKGTRDLYREYHFCCKECSVKSLSSGKLKEKIQLNNVAKYGSKSPAASKTIRDKIEKTNIEKYGVRAPLMSKNIQSKAQQTNIDKYGSSCSLINRNIDSKRQKTWLQKYGGNPLCCSEIREKIRQTMLDKYGEDSFVSTDLFKQLVIETNLERYGVKYAISSPEVRKKIEQTNLDRYGSASYTGTEDHKSKLDYDDIAQKAWRTKIQNGTCSKSLVEEKMYALLVKKYGTNNVKRQVPIIGQWVDFYLLSKKLFIQVDGVYWHGLNRPLEIISQMQTSQDEKIYKQIFRDQKLNSFMRENNLNFSRITDVQIKTLTEEELWEIIEK